MGTRLPLLPLLLAVVVSHGEAAAAVGRSRSSGDMPPPFRRELSLQSPPLRGDDVTILQLFLSRWAAAAAEGAAAPTSDGVFGNATREAVLAFQRAVRGEPGGVDGIVGPHTASLLLPYERDGYVDDGMPAAAYGDGILYKILVSVHRNRSIETTATLFDRNNSALHSFRVRAHGRRDDGEDHGWPDYSDDEGLSEFVSGGNTPTGLSYVDLNSPEPNPKSYGPFNVNRVVRGLRGNAAELLHDEDPQAPFRPARTGILLHTGQWPGWTQEMPMPNSAGCLHAPPDDVKLIAELLQSRCGVQVRQNPMSGKDYPFEPQGIISVQNV